MSTTGDCFPGFERAHIAGAGAEIFVRVGGSGPPLLCLHGHPETHVMWHRVAETLAQHFTLVPADLRGNGENSVPAALLDCVVPFLKSPGV